MCEVSQPIWNFSPITDGVSSMGKNERRKKERDREDREAGDVKSFWAVSARTARVPGATTLKGGKDRRSVCAHRPSVGPSVRPSSFVDRVICSCFSRRRRLRLRHRQWESGRTGESGEERAGEQTDQRNGKTWRETTRSSLFLRSSLSTSSSSLAIARCFLGCHYSWRIGPPL